MDVEHYYYVYGAMTQAMGALVAIVGVFMIFRIQIQRDKLGNTYYSLKSYFFNPTKWIPTEEIEKVARQFVEGKREDVDLQGQRAIRDYGSFLRHKNDSQYITNEGIEVIKSAVGVFIYYIIVLHLNYILYELKSNFFVFILGLIFSICVVVYLLCYVVKCLRMEANQGKINWIM